MPRVLVLYYSSYGHIEAMAYAQAEGAGRIAGAQVTVKRVPELTPPDVARAAGFKLEQRAPLARPEELDRSEEHTSELQSPCNLVCRLLLEKKIGRVKSNLKDDHFTISRD